MDAVNGTFDPYWLADIQLTTLFVYTTRYGCANPTLPALYARISEVDSWIRDMVCQHSENPPLEFGCPQTLALTYPCEDLPIGRDIGKSPNNATDGGSTSTNQGVQYNTPCTVLQPITVTLRLRLDTRPEERGWILRIKDDQGMWRTIEERPIFSYSDAEPLSTVYESVSVWDNREYEMVVLDSFGDGQDIDSTDSMVLEIRSQNGQVLLFVNDFSGMDMYHSSFRFTVGVPATFAPTQSMAPSVTMTPTSSPTEPRPFISLVIQFGIYPQNIGFRLEILENDNDGVELDGHNIDEYTLLHVVYPGNFAPEVEGARIRIEIPLRGRSAQKQTYRFTMTSNEGYGILNGGYEVWLGAALTGEYLFRGGDFYYEEAHTFSVEAQGLPSPTDAPIISPSLPIDDDLSQSTSTASSVTVTYCCFILVAWVPFLFR